MTFLCCPAEAPCPEHAYRGNIARPDAELPWLGDIDRRGDDDVEFCDEGDWLDD